MQLGQQTLQSTAQLKKVIEDALGKLASEGAGGSSSVAASGPDAERAVLDVQLDSVKVRQRVLLCVRLLFPLSSWCVSCALSW